MNDLLSRRKLGLMCQPASNPPRAGWLWAADNGCFSEKWDAAKWEAWLARDMPKAGCLFAVVPDVVGDATATLTRWTAFANVVRGLRYPTAFVLQDDAEVIPWDELDCLFIGGTTAYKMSPAAFGFAAEARERGKWVHVGRVNSHSRYRAWSAHADSCDGTFLAFGPRTNAPKLVRWLDAHDESPQLWSVA